MNEVNRITKIHEALRYLKFSNKSGSHVNCLRLHNNCSEIHNRKIIELALEFSKNNIPFITEAEFAAPYAGRADIINLATHDIYEIMSSETDEILEAKIKKYPEIFKIVKVRI